MEPSKKIRDEWDPNLASALGYRLITADVWCSHWVKDQMFLIPLSID